MCFVGTRSTWGNAGCTAGSSRARATCMQRARCSDKDAFRVGARRRARRVDARAALPRWRPGASCAGVSS
eukprot:11188269-Lingulodinium_polyedra.AAC.1